MTRSPISETRSTTEVPVYPVKNGKPVLVEIAPGQTVADLPPGEVSRVCLARLVPTGEPNTFRAVAEVHSAEIRLNAGILKKLHLGVEHCTMKRLIKAGFVEGGRVAPGCYTFDLQSYYNHVAQVRAAAASGEDFWTGENLEKYRAAI
jgi:hypothetical protein